MLALIFFLPQHSHIGKSLRNPPNITIQGPEGYSLFLSEGLHAELAGLEEDLYGKATVQKPGKPSMILELPPHSFCDGTYTQQQAPVIKDGRQDIPHQVWSKSGDYIVLSLVTRQSDGIFDFRNAEIEAFDVKTGIGVEFRGPTSRLSNDTFQNWSSEKPDVAILTGRNQKPEEAHRIF